MYFMVSVYTRQIDQATEETKESDEVISAQDEEGIEQAYEQAPEAAVDFPE